MIFLFNALQSGFYSMNGLFEKSLGIGKLGDKTIIHKETKNRDYFED